MTPRPFENDLAELAFLHEESAAPGPHLWLTACIHGDEAGGVAIVHDLFKWLSANPLLCGAVSAFPLVNEAGFKARVRTVGPDGADLNRSFPGTSDTYDGRLANFVFERIRIDRPNLVIDVHNDWVSTVPYLLIDPVGKPGDDNAALQEAISLGSKTGLLMITDTDDDAYHDQTLSGALILAGIPSITLEVGNSFSLNEIDVLKGLKAIMNIMGHLGMIESIVSPEPACSYPQHVQGKILRYSDLPECGSQGLMRVAIKPGQVVHQGDFIAAVFDATGNLLEQLYSEVEGVFLGYADYAYVEPGSKPFAFAEFSLSA